MRNLFLPVLFTAACVAVGEGKAEAGRIVRHLTVDGVVREVVLHVPDSVNGSQDVPVVFMLHGTSGDGDKFYNISGWKEKAAAELETAIKDGAIGFKIFKNLGLSSTKADGSRLAIDDPELDPLFEVCARLNVPVLIHTADPAQFFEEIDFSNERWLELALFPGRQYPSSKFPSFETLAGERDRLFARHPKTRFIAAHFGWHGNDLGRAAKMLDSMPNVYFEVGAVLYEFGRQPRAAREFFTKYQDRILFGKDAYEPTEYPYYFRVFETGDEYFDYYRNYHAFWKLYGMSLPDAVLRKLYNENAFKVAPGLPPIAR